MAQKTPIYEFEKPEQNDFYDVDVQNRNWNATEEALTKFDDSGKTDSIKSFPDFLAKFITGNKLAITMRNLKAGLQFVLHTGQIVNNCVTDNAGLPLSAAQGKVLKDLYTQLYSETERLNGYKVSYYGSFDKTLEELYDLSKMNTTCYIGFIDWKQSEITMEKGTIIWIACNWIVFGIANSGLYVLEGSPLAWKKIS